MAGLHTGPARVTSRNEGNARVDSLARREGLRLDLVKNRQIARKFPITTNHVPTSTSCKEKSF